MPITTDWHIHSGNSCDCACMKMSALIEYAAAKGITDFGVADHLHSLYNLPDIRASRAEFLACGPGPRFHFGVEVSCMSQWELDEIATGRHKDPVYGLREGGPPSAPLAIALRPEHVARLGIEYVIGGTHWPMYVPPEPAALIGDYHRQNMFLVTHPLITIVAHPWWWMGRWQDADKVYRGHPWMGDFGVIPRSVHDEFAAAAIKHGKVVEVNLCAILQCWMYTERFKQQYAEYLGELHRRGVKLSIGSDCHNDNYVSACRWHPRCGVDFAAAERVLASVGIASQDLWRLPPRTAG